MQDAVLTPFQIEGRSTLIITLGVLALIILGPISGVPAWIMANRDLRDIREGIISPQAYHRLATGRRLAIAGTFFSPLWLVMFIVFLFVFLIVLGEVLPAVL